MPILGILNLLWSIKYGHDVTKQYIAYMRPTCMSRAVLLKPHVLLRLHQYSIYRTVSVIL